MNLDLNQDIEIINKLCKEYNTEMNRATILLIYFIFSDRGVVYADDKYPQYRMTMREIFANVNSFISRLSKREFRNMGITPMIDEEYEDDLNIIRNEMKKLYKVTDKQHKVICEQTNKLTLLKCLKNNNIKLYLYFPECYSFMFEAIKVQCLQT